MAIMRIAGMISVVVPGCSCQNSIPRPFDTDSDFDTDPDPNYTRPRRSEIPLPPPIAISWIFPHREVEWSLNRGGYRLCGVARAVASSVFA